MLEVNLAYCAHQVIVRWSVQFREEQLCESLLHHQSQAWVGQSEAVLIREEG